MSGRNRWMILVCAVAVAAVTGACPSKRPKYPACDGDKDCQAGEKCVNKHCVQCSTNADCGAGKQCVEGGCEAIPGWCSADGDCAAGQVCKENKCSACQADNECGEGGKCREGRCLRKGQCDTDQDCPEDQDCVKGVCVKGGAQSTATGRPSCTLQPVYFDYDSSSIKEEDKGKLQADSECLSSTAMGVAVVGHTDSRGTDEYNIALSDQRARTVADYLSRLGVDSARLRIVPKGEAEAKGTDEGTWAKDRRVEFSWE